MNHLNRLIQMNIDLMIERIATQEIEIKKVQDNELTEWRYGFHEGLKMGYEMQLEKLKQIQREVERNEYQRPSATA